MINLVIAHSQQHNNHCAVGDTEQDHMTLIAEEIYNLLSSDKRFNLLLIPKLNVGTDNENLKKSIALSNEFIVKNGGGCHLEFHSDAGYSAHGVSGLYKTPAGRDLITPIVKELMALTPWNDVGIKQREDLGALNQTKAVAGIIEVAFHDKKDDATWIHQHIKDIVKAIVTGTYKSFNIEQVTGIRIRVKGEFIVTDVKPFIKNSRIVAPVRFIAEALGKKVKWDSNTQIVDIE